MEIQEIRQELNQLLENIVDHSGRYNAQRPIPSLEVSFVLSKINKMQEKLTILKFLLEQQEMLSKHEEKSIKEVVVQPEEEIAETPVFETPKEVEITPVIEEFVVEEPALEEVIIEAESPKSENLEQPSIPKLSDSLTLNDRYLYANELFNKDMNAFNELVKSIDTCVSMDEAIALYSSMDWELDNEHVISFTNLVERRFS
jgi:hypothetical protein